MNGAAVGWADRTDAIMRKHELEPGIPVIGPGVSIHFIGIGGIGMSGLARVCLERGCRVTGADARLNRQTELLSEGGATIRVGAQPDLVVGSDLVVYSSAVRAVHPERLRAAELGIPAIRRGSLLAHLTRDMALLGVAGTHGKTTTSAMLSLAVRAAGLDPTILLGGDLPNIGGNALLGSDRYCVAETDESDGSFLELDPHLAIVTNVEDDHLEHYGDILSLREAFRDFIGCVEAPERRILCADCPNLYALARRNFGTDFVPYGFSEAGDIRGVEIDLARDSSACRVLIHGKPAARLEIRVPGMHMLLNALGAFAAGLSLGLSADSLLKGLAEYRGTRRRFEVLGDWRGATLIDDYGHHPTEIEATLRALRQYSEGRCLVVFQPHRYSRTDQLFDEFAGAFGGVDLLILSEIYSAGEEPREGVTAKRLLSRIHGVASVVYAPTLGDVEEALREQVQAGDTVLFLGAGDINRVAYRLLEQGT